MFWIGTTKDLQFLATRDDCRFFAEPASGSLAQNDRRGASFSCPLVIGIQKSNLANPAASRQTAAIRR